MRLPFVELDTFVAPARSPTCALQGQVSCWCQRSFCRAEHTGLPVVGSKEREAPTDCPLLEVLAVVCRFCRKFLDDGPLLAFVPGSRCVFKVPAAGFRRQFAFCQRFEVRADGLDTYTTALGHAT